MTEKFSFMIARPWHDMMPFPSAGNICSFMIHNSTMMNGDREMAEGCLAYVRSCEWVDNRDKYVILKLSFSILE